MERKDFQTKKIMNNTPKMEASRKEDRKETGGAGAFFLFGSVFGTGIGQVRWFALDGHQFAIFFSFFFVSKGTNKETNEQTSKQTKVAFVTAIECLLVDQKKLTKLRLGFP